MTAWKDLERRVALKLGGRRTGPAGQAVSDVIGTPWSVEIKRAKTSFRVAWIEQAKQQGKKENKPWLLVVARHHDREPIAICDFSEFLKLAQKSGYAPLAVLGMKDDDLEERKRAVERRIFYGPDPPEAA